MCEFGPENGYVPDIHQFSRIKLSSMSFQGLIASRFFLVLFFEMNYSLQVDLNA